MAVTRHISGWLLAVVVISACGRSEQRTTTDARRAPSAPSIVTAAADGKRVRLLVVSDGIPQSYKAKFDKAVERARRAFGRIPGADPANLDVKPNFVAANALGESRFRLRFDASNKPCRFVLAQSTSGMPGTQELIERVDPSADYYLIVFGSDTDGACAMSDMMFVTYDTFADNIRHEMGHALGGLYDERDDGRTSHLKSSEANCSISSADPPWRNIYAPPARVGCDGSSRLFHPSGTCLMISSGVSEEFCDVCKALFVKLMKAPASTEAFVGGAAIRITALLTSDGALKPIRSLPVSPVDAIVPITSDTFVVVLADVGTEQERIVGVAPMAIDARRSSVHRERAVNLQGRGYSLGKQNKNGTAQFDYDTLFQVDSMLVRFIIFGHADLERLTPERLTLQLRSLDNPGRATLLNEQTIRRLMAEGSVESPSMSFILPP